MNTVTWSVPLKPENATLIDKINKMLIGGEASSTSSQETTTESASDAISYDTLKEAAKAAKATHGEDFAMQVLKDFKVDVGSTLGRSLKPIDESLYGKVIAAWENGPIEDEDDFGDGPSKEEDDDFGDDTSIAPDAVKTALKALANSKGRDAAKALMAKHKVKLLSEVDEASQATLAALMKELA